MGRCEGAILLLQLREQPHVLDCDDRLVGESLEERDLVVGESAGLAASHRDRPEHILVTEHWHHGSASPTTSTPDDTPRFRYAGIDLEIGGIESRSIANGLGVRIAEVG